MWLKLGFPGMTNKIAVQNLKKHIVNKFLKPFKILPFAFVLDSPLQVLDLTKAEVYRMKYCESNFLMMQIGKCKIWIKLCNRTLYRQIDAVLT